LTGTTGEKLNMAESRHRGFRQTVETLHGTSPYLIVGAAVSFFYVQALVSPHAFKSCGPALTLEISTWAAAMAIMARRNGNATRLGDPGVLFLAISALYLLYPSVAWMKTQTLAGVSISPDTASLLFVLHSLFIVAFILGYIWISPSLRNQVKLDLDYLPSGWSWLMLPLGLLVLSIGSRLVAGGAFLPSTNYSDNWSTLQDSITASRLRGGFGFLFTQISVHAAIYLIVIQGAAGGLILARVIKHGTRPYRYLFVIVILAAAVVIFGEGGRSPGGVIIIITFVFADLAIGPISPKLIAPVVVMGLLGFMLLGYYRTVRDLGPLAAATIAFESFNRSTDSDNAGEFTSMLAKEALILELYSNQPKEGLRYLGNSMLDLVPSQLFPEKLEHLSTADLLSERMLGPTAVAMGAGVAGTTIGDGYRFGGIPGVPALGFLFGTFMGVLQRWLLSTRPPGFNITFLKAMLVAGFYGFTYALLRNRLSEILAQALYGIVLPYLVLRFIIRCPRTWIMPSAPRYGKVTGRFAVGD
jgi:hypothetical protein